MNRDDILRMAREAGFEILDMDAKMALYILRKWGLETYLPAGHPFKKHTAIKAAEGEKT